MIVIISVPAAQFVQNVSSDRVIGLPVRLVLNSFEFCVHRRHIYLFERFKYCGIFNLSSWT
jgi:hypothetical protein